jgi:hypothetical protein
MNYLGSSTTLDSSTSSGYDIIFNGDVTSQFNVNDQIYGYNTTDDVVLFGCVTGSSYSSGCTTLCTTKNFGSASNIIVRNLTTSTQCGCASLIGNGEFNTSSGYLSFIGGGSKNVITGNVNFIGGGLCNLVNGDYAFTGGGRFNTTSGYYAFTGSGDCNLNDGLRSGIISGQLNNMCGYADSFIAGSCICAVAACTLHANCLWLGSIPTSSVGLPTGSVWVDTTAGNVLKIV